MATDRRSPRSLVPGQQSYGEFFGNIRIAGDLLADDPKQAWSTSVPADAPHHQYVVWLGCQMLRTAHLAESLNDILNHLAVDHATLGGPSNCCGVVHDRRGDSAVGDNLTRQTVRKFDAFTPEKMLYWCPSCDNQLRAEGEAFETETTRHRRSVAEFLSDRISSLELVEAVPVKVAVHSHHEFPEQQADAEAVRRLLSRISGLELVETPQLTQTGRHCSGNALKAQGVDAYLAKMRGWIDEARGAGAERIVSVYHSCHRQMVVAQVEMPAEHQLPVENYLTLTAMALGIKAREDKYARFMKSEVDDVMVALSGRIESLGLDRERARRAIAAQFESKRPS